MTVQELMNRLKTIVGDGVVDDPGWTEIASAVNTTIAASTTGLANNKEKILGEKKQLQEKLEELQDKLRAFEELGVTVEDYTSLKSEVEELRKQVDSNGSVDAEHLRKKSYEDGKKAYQTEVEPRIKQLQTENEELRKRYEGLASTHIQGKVRTQIDRVLNEIGIAADTFFLDGLYHSAKFSYNDVEDFVEVELPSPSNRSTYIPLRDWAVQYPASDEGKKYVRISSTGAGATGGSAKSSNKNESMKDHIARLIGDKG